MNDGDRDEETGVQHDDGDWDDEPYDDEPYDDELDDEADDWSGRGGAGWAALLAAGVVGVVTTLVLVLLWSTLSSGEDESGPAADRRPASFSGADADTDTDTGAETDGPERTAATRLGRCVRAERALRDPLDAAGPTIDQWQVHVEAMNDLVVGEITLQQATEFWNRTRVGAQRRVATFDEAVEELTRRGVDCPAPDLLAPGARALAPCAREVEAHVRALRAARVSVATWEEHIRHMDMLRLGQMTPEEATTMWLDSWRRGVRDLDTYEAAARASGRADGCGRVGSSS